MQLGNQNIQLLKSFFADKPVIKAYLFGSYSRDDADENSDIDILLELDYSNLIGMEFIKMQLDLEDLLRKKVDLLTEQSVSKYLKPYIEKEKKLIYERQAG